MKVFISWSGERSKTVALAIRKWLPRVIQAAKPWMSEKDIKAGASWGKELKDKLEGARFGIICVTPENQNAPWIHFEAGAISKTVGDENFVCPYLIDLKPSELDDNPLTQFQAKQANSTGTWEIVEGINFLIEDRLDRETLKDSFERWWPDLEREIASLLPLDTVKKEQRSSDDILEEILELVRQMARTPQVVTPAPVIRLKPYNELTLSEFLKIRDELRDGRSMSLVALKELYNTAHTLLQESQENDPKAES